MKAWLIALMLSMPGLAAASDFSSLLNDWRTQNGRNAVQASATLMALARTQAEHMEKQGTLSHIGPKGRSVGKRARKAGYKWCHIAENVAQGQRSDAAVLQAWAGSKPHRKNMALRKVRHFGMYRTASGFSVLILAQPGCR